MGEKILGNSPRKKLQNPTREKKKNLPEKKMKNSARENSKSTREKIRSIFFFHAISATGGLMLW